MNPERMSEEDILNTEHDSPIGYILEVDLQYPEYLHDSHNDYPLAPERIEIKREMLSPYSVAAAENAGVKIKKIAPKLVPNLYDKERYVLHYRNLQLYIALGLKLQKIHK